MTKYALKFYAVYFSILAFVIFITKMTLYEFLIVFGTATAINGIVILIGALKNRG